MRRLAGLCALAGCAAGSSLPAVRFANAPAIAVVDDRRDVPQAPVAQRTLATLYGYDGSVHVPITHALDVRRHERARGVNALDEVPDSTWFTNRVHLTPEQIRRGPSTGDSPEDHLPWTIEKGQDGGTSDGFLIKDARGVRYLLKFDHPGFPEVETGIDVVVDRLLWACGYNVPDDRVVELHPADLVLPPGAKLDRTAVDRVLAKHPHQPDGSIRGIASRYLEGKPLGAPPFEGVRADDPNDRIPHELRRDLRGTRAIFGWLDVVDLQPGNFLDMWVADPADPARHYVEHDLLDFGKSLGGMGAMDHDLRRGRAYRLDWGDMARSLFTIGIVEDSWVDRPVVAIRGVASGFDAASYDPGSWRPDIPFPPLEAADRIDQYWGAKIVARLTRDQIHAAVEAGRFSDPRAVEYLTDTLVARGRKTAAHWFARVAPIENAAFDDGLCFDDLAIAGGFATATATRYTIATYDQTGHALAAPTAVAARAARTCVAIPATTGYAIAAIEIARGGHHLKAYIHIGSDATAGRRSVIGIWRD